MKALLALFLIAQGWVYLGATQDKMRVYTLRRSATTNADGNMVVTLKYRKKGSADRVAKWECDCKQRQVRPIAEGKTLDDLEKIDEQWTTPVKDSLFGKILKRFC